MVRERDALAHAVLEHHRARDRGHALEIVGGAGRDAAEHHLLGGASGQQHRDLVDQLLARADVAVLLGQVERVAERVAARHDRDLVERVGVAEQVRDERVAGLVVGDDALLLLGDHAARLQAGEDALERPVEVVRRDDRRGRRGRPASRPRCRCSRGRRRRGRPCAARRASRSTSGASGLSRVWTSRIARAAGQVGHADTSTWRSKRPGRSSAGSSTSRRFDAAEHDHAGVLREAVQLDQQLVQGLVLLAVQARPAAGGADGVELVDEHDRRARACARSRTACGCGRRRRRRTSRRRRRADCGEERGARLVRHRLREQRLAGAGRPVQQDRPSGRGRRASRSAAGRAGSRRPRAARPWPRRGRRCRPSRPSRRCRDAISFGFVRGIIATARYMKYRSATSRTIGSQTIRKPRIPSRMASTRR